jgi:hypothetical protein
MSDPNPDAASIDAVIKDLYARQQRAQASLLHALVRRTL